MLRLSYWVCDFGSLCIAAHAHDYLGIPNNIRGSMAWHAPRTPDLLECRHWAPGIPMDERQWTNYCLHQRRWSIEVEAAFYSRMLRNDCVSRSRVPIGSLVEAPGKRFMTLRLGATVLHILITDAKGRLVPNTTVGEKVLSGLTIIFAVVGTAGLILLSIFDTANHHKLHDIFLLLFIAGLYFPEQSTGNPDAN
jgi:hypothetical protein